jgi:hypothetical protein
VRPAGDGGAESLGGPDGAANNGARRRPGSSSGRDGIAPLISDVADRPTGYLLAEERARARIAFTHSVRVL